MTEFETPNYKSIVRQHHLDMDLPLKAYFADIQGRNPEKFEWDVSGIKLRGGDAMDTLVSHLMQSDHVGVPHVAILYPHFTRVFRFGDPRKEQSETNVYSAGLFRTPDLVAGRVIGDRPRTVACLGEAEIIGIESGFWGEAESSSKYLEMWVPDGRYLEAVNPNKLGHLVRKT